MDAQTPKSKATKTRRVIRAAFVVTAALGAAGCESTTNPPSPCLADTPCNPPAPECPADGPVQGDFCSIDEGPCVTYDECGNAMNATCVDGQWEIGSPSVSCNPPGPECPVERPSDGDLCDIPSPGGCTYQAGTACGIVSVSAECVDDPTGTGAWVWQLVPPACTPETPNCSPYADPSLCAADTTCRWLVPGCSDEPPDDFAAGCYPIGDCAADSCALDETCSIVGYDPCWNSLCDACDAPASICLPSMAGG